MLVDVANRIEGHTICALGDAAAWPVQSFLQALPPRVRIHDRSTAATAFVEAAARMSYG
jgi:NADH-quinone oxidoreductase subunit F